MTAKFQVSSSKNVGEDRFLVSKFKILRYSRVKRAAARNCMYFAILKMRLIRL